MEARARDGRVSECDPCDISVPLGRALRRCRRRCCPGGVAQTPQYVAPEPSAAPSVYTPDICPSVCISVSHSAAVCRAPGRRPHCSYPPLRPSPSPVPFHRQRAAPCSHLGVTGAERRIASGSERPVFSQCSTFRADDVAAADRRVSLAAAPYCF